MFAPLTHAFPAMLQRDAFPLRVPAHLLPLWFLVLALFLPRLALFLAWFEQFRFPLLFPVNLILWLLLPRALVLIMIYTRQGIDLWFWAHLLAALLVYAGGSHRVVYRRRYADG